MVVNAIYHGSTRIQAVYRGSQLIFQGVEPFEFHLLEDGKLIIVGALSTLSLDNGLYMDCSPNAEWNYPVLENGVLTITQAYSASPNGNTLEVG